MRVDYYYTKIESLQAVSSYPLHPLRGEGWGGGNSELMLRIFPQFVQILMPLAGEAYKG